MTATWNLLAIDDSLTIRKLIGVLFKQPTFALDLAADGGEGIERAKRGLPDLILLDYVLPDMRGVEVCRALAEDERTRSIPVVIMTAKGSKVRGDFQEFSSVVEIVGKPFTPPQMLELVKRILGQKSPKKAAASAASASEGTFSYKQREAAAKALFGSLRTALAKIPGWAAERGSRPRGSTRKPAVTTCSACCRQTWSS